MQVLYNFGGGWDFAISPQGRKRVCSGSKKGDFYIISKQDKRKCKFSDCSFTAVMPKHLTGYPTLSMAFYGKLEFALALFKVLFTFDHAISCRATKGEIPLPLSLPKQEYFLKKLFSYDGIVISRSKSLNTLLHNEKPDHHNQCATSA